MSRTVAQAVQHLSLRERWKRQRRCRGFRFRNDVMIVEPPSKRGVCGELRIADAQIGIGRVVSEAVFARATLHQRHPLTAQPLVSEQSCGSALPVRARQDGRQRHAILDRLIGALPEVRKHWMRGIAEQAQPSLGRTEDCQFRSEGAVMIKQSCWKFPTCRRNVLSDARLPTWPQ